MKRHRWTLTTKTGNDKCGECGLIRVSYGTGKHRSVSYFRGNKRVGLGPLMNKVPACNP